jgi:hypothetical protein
VVVEEREGERKRGEKIKQMKQNNGGPCFQNGTRPSFQVFFFFVFFSS